MCACACACVCVRVCVRACVSACVCMHGRGEALIFRSLAHCLVCLVSVGLQFALWNSLPSSVQNCQLLSCDYTQTTKPHVACICNLGARMHKTEPDFKSPGGGGGHGGEALIFR